MSDENEDEGFRVVEGGEPVDDDVAPGRSVFGDDDVSFEDDDAAVPHWSEPATGTVPQVGGTADAVTFAPPDEPVLAEAEPDDLATWAEVASSPRWADEHDDLPPAEPVGAIEEGDGAADDFFAFDDAEAPAAADESLGAALGTTKGTPGGDRDLPAAVIVGIGLAALILAAMMVGPAAAVAVVTVILGLAAVEFFNALRVAGHQPAVLLGLAAVVTMPLGVYWRGEAAIGLVLTLSVIFGALWYLTGVGNESPVRGLGTTLLGIVHIGVLGSYAALMLSLPTIGTGLLTAAIIVTVAHDVGALAVGRTMGRSPLSPASPNKTVEGLVGGCLAAIGAAIVMGLLSQPSPLADTDIDGGGFGAMLLLGVAAAAAAPIGDLAESQLKRDIGVKDMGSMLPGHGGLLDRFDALLFVLPKTYFVARIVLF